MDLFSRMRYRQRYLNRRKLYNISIIKFFFLFFTFKVYEKKVWSGPGFSHFLSPAQSGPAFRHCILSPGFSH